MAGLPNALPPIELDVAQPPARLPPIDAIFSANTLHIMAWPQVEQFFAPARRGVLALVDGRPTEAESGESLLAALWNAGARAVRTSVTGEARGPLCGMGTCFECRVTVDGRPGVRACLETVREGMRVETAT